MIYFVSLSGLDSYIMYPIVLFNLSKPVLLWYGSG